VRFDANITFLFTEAPLVERFGLAAEAGFGAVELWWPAGEDLDAVASAAAEAGLEVVAMNFDGGDLDAGERGLLSDPARRERFRENVRVALELAGKLGCKRLNALAGLELPELAREKQVALAIDNARFAADAAAAQGATILIEPINPLDNGPYLLPDTAAALEFIDRLERDNAKLLFDTFQAQRMEGNLTATIREHAGRFGHVQIADSPDRGEPGSGELAFPYLFAELEAAGYDGWVGLEYRPRGTTEESLAWLPREARSGSARPDQLFTYEETSA
jgi:hydroxypyruvate isomerase